MRIYEEMDLSKFEAWSDGEYTKMKILDAGKEQDFEMWIDELYPDGLEDTQLNDILWFESDYIYEILGLDENGDLKDDEEDFFEEVQ